MELENFDMEPLNFPELEEIDFTGLEAFEFTELEPFDFTGLDEAERGKHNMDWAELEGCITTKELNALMQEAKEAGYTNEPDALIPDITYGELKKLYPNTAWKE